MSENLTVVAELPKPSLLKRLPVKKIAIVALVAASAVIIARDVKDQLNSEPSTPESIEA